MYITFAVSMFAVFIMSIILHEVGHWLVLSSLAGYPVRIGIDKWKIYVGTKLDYVTLSDKQYCFTSLVGVVLGVVPIIIASGVVFEFSLLIFPYLAGQLSDLKIISKYMGEHLEE